MEFKNIKITEHAKERYAERIMGKQGKNAIIAFAATHGDKIEEDISKMIEFGECIYSGRDVSDRDQSLCAVILSGTWILLVNVENNKLITLYKIDLGIGEDFNKEYVSRLVQKMKDSQMQLEEVRKNIADKKQDYLSMIEENEKAITEYRTMITKLEKLNSDYKSVVQDLDVECSKAEMELKQTIKTLIGKRIA